MCSFPIKKILVDDAARGYALTARILEKMAGVPVYFGSGTETEISHNPGLGKTTLHLLTQKGEILKPCPGTKEYICCGYQILNAATNCPLNCSYCILQSYFNQPYLKIFVNLEERLGEVLRHIDRNPHKIFRIGTGEFTDSLALDPVIQWSAILVPPFSKRKNAVLEFKTKRADVRQLLAVPERDRIIVSWSLNSRTISGNEEHSASSLRKRLKAAAWCQSEGFALGFHFDPLIPHENWREEYSQTLALMDRHIDPKGIIWISMGSFRYMPPLKKIIRQRHSRTMVLDGEFIPGLDGKMRYFRPLRTELYEFMRKQLELWNKDLGLYLCMESHEVWRDAMGWSPLNSEGLSHYLDDRVRQFFGGSHPAKIMVRENDSTRRIAHKQ